ncbi:MAG: DinB family protein [Chloroflexi bacterium]|nr:DinB family protein [Chloroflexota bacterium]
MSPADDPLTLLAAIEAEQQRLRDLLSARDPSTLAERPPSGKWSVVENVRHLIFAEQSHLGRLVPGGRTWSPLGLPPHNMSLPAIDTAASPGITEVLEAWQAVHAATRTIPEPGLEPVRKNLDKNLRHLRAHTRVIERLLRDGG